MLEAISTIYSVLLFAISVLFLNAKLFYDNYLAMSTARVFTSLIVFLFLHRKRTVNWL